jgi:TPR repeat protein
LGELRSVADQGDAEAQYLMGIRYHSGEGVPHDDAKAVEWFERAAEQGQVDAQSLLGAYYWAGRGVPANLSKAYYWSVIALAGGDDNSRSRLEGLAAQMTAPQVSAARQQAEAWIRQHTISRKTAVN